MTKTNIATCDLIVVSITLLVVSMELRRRLPQNAANTLPTYNAPNILPLWSGPRLHEFGRPCEWKAQHRFLGSPRFKASIGPNYYQDQLGPDPHFYSIDVEEQRGDAWYVLAQKDFLPTELPPGFLQCSIEEVVTFLPNTHTVVFTIGTQQLCYDR